jgi:hypothetical protein
MYAECQQHGASASHGADGSQLVVGPRPPNLLSCIFVEAGVEAGRSRHDDVNGATHVVGVVSTRQGKGAQVQTQQEVLGDQLPRCFCLLALGPPISYKLSVFLLSQICQG